MPNEACSSESSECKSPSHAISVNPNVLNRVWAVASAVGPPLGGAFAQQVSWRWVFCTLNHPPINTALIIFIDLNLPITGLAIAIVFFFLHLNAPKQTFKEKMARMDWMYVPPSLVPASVCAQVSLSSGNILIIGGCTSAIVGLSWAGIQAPWDSAKTLVPIIIGLLTLVAAVVYEAKVPKEPTVSSTLPKTFSCLTTSRFHLKFSRIERLYSGKRSRIGRPVQYLTLIVYSYITTGLQSIVLSALGCRSIHPLLLVPLTGHSQYSFRSISNPANSPVHSSPVLTRSPLRSPLHPLLSSQAPRHLS